MNLPPGLLPTAVEEAITRYLDFTALLRSAGLAATVPPLLTGETRDDLLASFLTSEVDGPLADMIDRDLRRMHRHPAVAARFAAPAIPRWRRWIERRVRALARRPAPQRVRLPRMRDVVPEVDRNRRQEEADAAFLALLDRPVPTALTAEQLAAAARFLVSPGHARTLSHAIGRVPPRIAALSACGVDFASPFDPVILPVAIRNALLIGDTNAALAMTRPLLGLTDPIDNELVSAVCSAAIEGGAAEQVGEIIEQWHARSPASKHALLTRATLLAVRDPAGALTLTADLAADHDVAPRRAVWQLRCGDADAAEQTVRARLPALLDHSHADWLCMLEAAHRSRGDPGGFVDAMFALEGTEVRWSAAEWADLSAAAPFCTVTVFVAAGEGEPIEDALARLGVASNGTVEAILVGAAPAVRADKMLSAANLAEAVALASGELVAWAAPGSTWLGARLASHAAVHAATPGLQLTLSLRLRADEAGQLSASPNARYRTLDHAQPVIRREALRALIADRPLHDVRDVLRAVMAVHGEGAIGVIDRVLAIEPFPLSADGRRGEPRDVRTDDRAWQTIARRAVDAAADGSARAHGLAEEALLRLPLNPSAAQREALHEIWTATQVHATDDLASPPNAC